MELDLLVPTIADVLQEFDSERPTHKTFQAGIGPFGEPQIVKEIANRLTTNGINSRTRRTPDLDVAGEWAVEFKIVRPHGDNGIEAEDWSVNMLHPYPGNTSLIGDGIKLQRLEGYPRKGLFVIGFEHDPARIPLEPLISSFELLAQQVARISLGRRIEQRRAPLVHPVHQVLRCIGWEVFP